MNESLILITLGGLLLLGLATEMLTKITALPRVTLLIGLGIVVGPAGLDFLPVSVEVWYELFADFALLMVGFLLGGQLSVAALRQSSREVLSISLGEVIGVAILIFLGLRALGVDMITALLLAGIAPASAPAAIKSVTEEVEGRSHFKRILLGIVAVDDAWGLILFSILLATAQAVSGTGGIGETILYGVWELGGATLLGLGLGVPAAYLTGRLKPGRPTQAEALGVVLLCGGLALYFEVSFLLSAMVLGAIIENYAHHHDRPFREIENIDWPFMIIFFVLAGAALHFDKLYEMGLIGLAYVVLRVAGLVAGAWIGGFIGRSRPQHRRWMGLAITPQAGVALGMALVAGSRFPDLKDDILAIVIGTTVMFELFGPILTRLAIRNASGP